MATQKQDVKINKSTLLRIGAWYEREHQDLPHNYSLDEMVQFALNKFIYDEEKKEGLNPNKMAEIFGDNNE